MVVYYSLTNPHQPFMTCHLLAFIRLITLNGIDFLNHIIMKHDPQWNLELVIEKNDTRVLFKRGCMGFQGFQG